MKRRRNPCWWKKRKKNPVAVRGRNVFDLPKGAVRIYAKVERIWCRKGKDSNYPGKPFEHTFRTKPELWGLPDGSLLIISRDGRRLWGRYKV